MDAVSYPRLPSERGRQQRLPARGFYCKLHQWLYSYTHHVPLQHRLQGMEHVHIGLVVHRTDCKLYDQSEILPFIETISDDLEKAQKKRIQKWAMLLLPSSGQLQGRCPQSSLTASYTPPFMRLKCPWRTNTTSTPGAILQRCTQVPACATPCTS